MNRWRGAVLACVLAAGWACNEVDDFDERVLGPDGLITLGDADFTRYVAIGDSYGAGIVNGAFTCAGQIFSYPAIIARQAGLEAADRCNPPEVLSDDVSVFQQPLVTDPGVGSPLALTNPGPPPVITPVAPTGVPTNGDLFRPYNNLSVPGMEVSEVNFAVNQATSQDNNAAFNVVLRGIATAPEQAAALDATFVTFWLGGDDVLESVLAGGTVDVTPTNEFRTQYRAALNVLLEVTTDVVIANVTDVSALPFATTIPPVVVNPATGQPVLDPTGNPIPLIGDNGRPLDPAAELVTLRAAPFLAQGIGIPAAVGGSGLPLPDEVVLDRGELQNIERALEGYNAAIVEAATEAELPLVDVDAELQAALAGGGLVQANGDVLSIRVLGGGQANPFFGLDGLHPTPKGYGHIANLFIETINQEYGSGIPLVNVGSLPTYIPSAAAPAGLVPLAQGVAGTAWLYVAWPAEVDTELW